jgi:hypothetical protein
MIDSQESKMIERNRKIISVFNPLNEKGGSCMIKKSLMLCIALIGSIASTGFANCPSSCNTACNTTTVSSCSTKNCGCPGSAKTFLEVRPLYQSVRPELMSQFHNDVMFTEEGIGGAFDIVAFGGRSTKPERLASYFLPFCKTQLSVSEAADTGADLLATNFNIFTVDGAIGSALAFTSTLSFAARRSEAGLGLHYKQGFGFNEARTAWWYVDINAPITWVRNQFCMTERVGNTGGGVNPNVPGAVANMTAAFNQTAWNFGKINPACPLKKTGLADIELKFGTEVWCSENCNIGGYVGVLIPTGNLAQAVYVFEPIVGNGKHVGVMWGSEVEFNIWKNCDESWCLDFYGNMHSLYLFKKKQNRSFDLKGKPWSRYISMYANATQAAAAATLCADGTLVGAQQGAALSTPGINILTQCVDVRPGYSLNALSSFVLKQECGFLLEVGYNVYAREKDCISLAYTPAAAIKSELGCGATSVIRNISANPFFNNPCDDIPSTNYGPAIIQQTDIDVESAETPAGIASIIHGALGYEWKDRCNPLHVGIGGSYEFGSNDFGMLNRWVVWGKFGISF